MLGLELEDLAAANLLNYQLTAQETAACIAVPC